MHAEFIQASRRLAGRSVPQDLKVVADEAARPFVSDMYAQRPICAVCRNSYPSAPRQLGRRGVYFLLTTV